jgi:hypothetical protein
MTSLPRDRLPTFTFPACPKTAADTHDSRPQTAKIPPSIDGQRPGLTSRAPSQSSTRTIRPHHVSKKSLSAVPTISNLSVGHSELPTYLKSPKMANANGSTSSGAADLLRQAMMQK